MFVRTLARLIIRFRIPITLLVIILTGFFLYETFKIQSYHNLYEIVPQAHPYVKLHKDMEELFGGANLVSIALVVEEGDIFNVETLSKVYRITERLMFMRGVVPYRVVSIASRKLRRFYITQDTGGWITFHSPSLENLVKEIMEKKEPKLMDFYREGVINNPQIYGPIVSKDRKGTLIFADFWDEKDFKHIFQELRKIIREEEDSNTRIFIGGRPVLLGYIDLYMDKMLFLFGLSVIAMAVLLYINFKTLKGALLPLLAGFQTIIWGLGLMGLFRIKLDMMNVTIPFMLMSIEVSHAVQIIKRYYEEFSIYGDKYKAVEETMTGLFKPAVSAIVTDGAGFAALMIIPFRIIQKMGVLGIGIVRLLLTTLVFLPAFLAILPAPSKKEIERAERAGLLEKMLNKLGYFSLGKRGGALILIFSTLLLVLGLIGISRLVIGDARKGSPYFWEDSSYNRDDHLINTKFAGADPYYIYIKTKEDLGLADPKLAKMVNDLSNFLRQNPQVGYVNSYVELMKDMNMAWNNNDSKWNVPPDNRNTMAEFLIVFEQSVEPEVPRSYFDATKCEANIQVLVKDHTRKTIKKIVKETQDFLSSIRKNPEDNFEIHIAAGNIGLYASIIDIIERWFPWNLSLISFAIFFFTAITFQSLVAGLLVLIPLQLSNLLTLGYMGFTNIGLFLPTIPVASMGMGLGVDYALYVLGRLQQELKEGLKVEEAFCKALTTSGKAVMFIATSRVCGLMTMLLSSLRFQVEMSVTEILIVVANMFGALVLLPALISLFKPKFIYGQVKDLPTGSAGSPDPAK